MLLDFASGVGMKTWETFPPNDAAAEADMTACKWCSYPAVSIELWQKS